MKHLVTTLFTFCLILNIGNVHAQDFPYLVTSFTEGYTPISNGTSVNNGQVWDDPDFSAPIGFDFELFGETMNQLYWVGAVGAIVTAGGYYNGGPGLVPYGSDIIDRGYFAGGPSQSPIVYEVTGTAPNRIFKMEWQNAGFYAEDPSISYVNFQLWLYETTNVVEYHFGPSEILSPVHDYGGPLIGLIDYLDIYNYDFGYFYVLYGPPGDPSVDPVDLTTVYDFENVLDSDPEDGRVFRFAPAQAVNVTLHVDMNKLIADGGTVSPDGVHVAGNFQGWDPGATLMTDDGDGTWSYTFTALAGSELQYKFINGTTWADAETGLTLDCGVDDGFGGVNRLLSVADADVETIDYCFGYCVTCSNIPTGINEAGLQSGLQLFPNPASETVQLMIDLAAPADNLEISLFNAIGQQILYRNPGQIQSDVIEIDVRELPAGMYLLSARDGESQYIQKLIVE